jgi:hypothetical protein
VKFFNGAANAENKIAGHEQTKLKVIMFKRIVAILGLGAATVSAAESFSFQGCKITAPVGWKEISRTNDALTFRSADGKEQATISEMSFSPETTFENFKKICDKRMIAEKKVLSDGFVNPSEPFNNGNLFGMFFSGGDKKSGRVFSGYLSFAKNQLITVYVEGTGVSPENHLATFKTFASSLKRE